MIEQLSIQNFQAHSKTKIEFDPAITCIIGPSDTGKSAIIRALRWVCMNQPGGNSFIQHETKGCTVKVIIDGKTIIRKRSTNDSINKYLLDEEEYKAFGRNVPEPISKVINIDSICWQGQHDPSYWFNSTAGEVSRQLNAIVDLSIIDSTLSAITQTVNKAATKLEITENNLIKAEKTFQDLEWVPKFSKAVSKLKTKGKDASDKRKKAIEIKTLFHEVKKYNSIYKRAKIAAEFGKVTDNTGTKLLEIQNKINTLRYLVLSAKKYTISANVKIPNISMVQKAVDRHQAAFRNALVLQKSINSAKHYRKIVEIEIPSIINMQKAITNYHELKSKINKLSESIHYAKNFEKEITKCQTEIRQIMKKMPKVCPTCNQPLK